MTDSLPTQSKSEPDPGAVTIQDDLIDPFSALVGQEPMKLALILTAIHPGLGGARIRGPKRAAKSTAVRALAALLPDIEVVADDPFRRSPAELIPEWPLSRGARFTRRPATHVNLPVGATDDRVVDSLNLERALTTEQRTFEPGLLSKAHRGLLSIDEVDLLGDHLVDVLLDAAAMGVNHVEREKVAFRPPARFVLVGTMNPEEGGLRPHSPDRFGLAVDEFLPSVVVPDKVLEAICGRCLREGADSLRTDLTISDAAAALAAHSERAKVTTDDVDAVAELALARRRTSHGSPPPPPPPLSSPPPSNDGPSPSGRPSTSPHGEFYAGQPHRDDPQVSAESEAQLEPSEPQIIAPARPTSAPRLTPPRSRIRRAKWCIRQISCHPPAVAPCSRRVGFSLPLGFGWGRQAKAYPTRPRSPWRGEGHVNELGGCTTKAGQHGGLTTPDRRGVFVRATVPKGRAYDPAILATFGAASPWQIARGGTEVELIIPRDGDLRDKVRALRTEHLVHFVVDSSRSMGARRRMSRTKGAVLALLIDAYEKSERVRLIASSGTSATHPILPARSARAASRRLEQLPVGKLTHLSHESSLAKRTIATVRRREPGITPLVVSLTDAQGNVPLQPSGNRQAEALSLAHRSAQNGVAGLVIDTEEGPVRSGLAAQVARAWGADILPLDSLGELHYPDAVQNAQFAG